MPITFAPTQQQVAMRDLSMIRETFKGLARAGTGKTASAEIIVDANRNLPKKIIYLVFGKPAQVEAKAKMARITDNVECRTWHSLAWGPTVGGGVFKGRLAKYKFDLVTRIEDDKVIYDAVEAARGDNRAAAFMVMATIEKWCHQAEKRLDMEHIPSSVWAKGRNEKEKLEIAEKVLASARKLWTKLCERGCDWPILHDHYLKYWQLSEPDLTRRFGMMILDEAQDQDPSMIDVVLRQMKLGIPIIAFGDPEQSIYGWRGADNAMVHLPGKTLPLNESFRFGADIAMTANVVLALSNQTLPVVGRGPEGVVIDGGAATIPDAFLCRGNAGVVRETINMLDHGVNVGVVGGTGEAISMLYGAWALHEGRQVNHPEIGVFRTWEEFQEFAETEEGTGYKPIIQMIEYHGGNITNICQRLKTREYRGETLPEDHEAVQVLVSTAHKAKGREWKRVRISDDFFPVTEQVGEEKWILRKEEANLQYVAITRAKKHLNTNGLQDQLAEDARRLEVSKDGAA